MDVKDAAAQPMTECLEGIIDYEIKSSTVEHLDQIAFMPLSFEIEECCLSVICRSETTTIL